ncbi:MULTISPECIES: phycobiliprotein lyase [Nostoc]|uniref:Chromophore lyase CpcS/CpeS n=1 Tax=Nostoc paludosum FACHB-159 TaxID=2692908 RepID=A0ABR8K7D7_9NOSO|nr:MULTISPECIES: phycobiliprotein lyase [Nostoc]MBD2678665.1 phycobiliprotein lyase [Nostoc sp. FACHB-857]MBD2734716.1 phycobiliprotein lyase [Nostoc paludosum FACHB-159]
MNIEEFFQLSAGKWFSHRTIHHLALNQSEHGKSDTIIETLPADHPEVSKLCQQYEINPSSASCALKVTWNGTMEGEQVKHSGSTVLVSVPDTDNPAQGKLLRQIVDAQKTLVPGRYQIDSDGALTLITEDETIKSEERLWFASPNLRMRVNVLKRSGGFNITSFTSEIRLAGFPPAAKTSEAAKSVSS